MLATFAANADMRDSPPSDSCAMMAPPATASSTTTTTAAAATPPISHLHFMYRNLRDVQNRVSARLLHTIGGTC